MDADPRPAYSWRARPLASGQLLLAAALAGCFVVQPGASSALRAALANEPRRDAPVLPETPYPYAASAESVAARLSGRAPGGIGNRGGRGGGGRGGRGGFGNARDNTPDSNAVTDAGATLGRVLFYDRRLSANDQIACGSCHMQEFGFSDTAR